MSDLKKTVLLGKSDGGEQLEVRLYMGVSDPASHPSTFIDVDDGFQILGGGCTVSPSLCLITEMYPDSKDGGGMGTRWAVAGKDHIDPDTGCIAIAYCIAARVKATEVTYPKNTSKKSAYPTVTAKIKNDPHDQNPFVLVGGGAKANWTGAGSLLYASTPAGTNGWFAGSKEHEIADPSTINAWAIGLRQSVLTKYKLRALMLSATDFLYESTSTARLTLEQPPASCVVGGGAHSGWLRGEGNKGRLLMMSRPSYEDDEWSRGWDCLAKDHRVIDEGRATAWGIALIPAA